MNIKLHVSLTYKCLNVTGIQRTSTSLQYCRNDIQTGSGMNDLLLLYLERTGTRRT